MSDATPGSRRETYLPIAMVGGHRLVDGGVWANNPSVVGVAEAVSMLGVPLEAVRVLNIGTLDTIGAHELAGRAPSSRGGHARLGGLGLRPPGMRAGVAAAVLAGVLTTAFVVL